jgi:hypothetical protein
MHNPKCLLSWLQLALLVSSGLGLTINHSMFVCTRVNEPLMTSVAGNLKNAIMTVVGALAFPDFKFSPPNVAGLALSMAGAIWYAMRSALKASAKSFNGSSSSNLMQQLPSFGMGGMARFKSSRSGSFNDDELLLPKEGQNGAGVLGPARLAKVEAK